jgi:NAD(P)-dependent dehydrogenase (short-subunit alcohol dehydrogenase family)
LRLKNKVCVITGSSRGIGATIARAYAREGAIVVITYNNEKDKALKVAKDTGSSLVLKMDVSVRKSVRSAFKRIADTYGRIDVLVNNAGINRTADFDKQTDEEWDSVMDVDLKGVFICCQEALKYLSKDSRIINIGSLSGQYGGPRTPSYCAAKAGVQALTQCLAIFLGPKGIPVNCLSPGVIASELTSTTMAPKVKKQALQRMLFKRFANYNELEESAILLAGKGASYITAQTINVNGGAWWSF